VLVSSEQIENRVLEDKMKIMNDDGSIAGWFMAFCETVIVFGLLVAGFFFKPIRDAWKDMGGYVQTIFPLTLGSWFAYKAVEVVRGSKNT